MHWLTTWTPADNQQVGMPPTVAATLPPVPEARLTVFGADLHYDDETYGNWYIGYSHVDAKNLGPLGTALQVIHGSNGKGFKEDYFGPKDRKTQTYTNDTGTVDTVLFQGLLRLAPMLGYTGRGRDIAVTGYFMFNHVRSPSLLGQQQHSFDRDVNENRLKFGSEVEVALTKWVSAGVRYDFVRPDLGQGCTTTNLMAGTITRAPCDAGYYQAISPRLIFHSNWKSKEYVIVNYSRFFGLGPAAYPGSPYNDLPYLREQVDRNMLMISAIMSLS
jgi:hypothetical protein